MFRDWITYGAIVLYIILYATNALTISHLLSLYPQLYVVPFTESLCIIFTLIDGGIILREFESYSAQELSFVLLGCLITLSGLVVKALGGAG